MLVEKLMINGIFDGNSHFRVKLNKFLQQVKSMEVADFLTHLFHHGLLDENRVEVELGSGVLNHLHHSLLLRLRDHLEEVGNLTSI